MPADIGEKVLLAKNGPLDTFDVGNFSSRRLS